MQARKKGNAQGIDVSHHQGDIDFKKVAADGISFVFIKATQGKTFRSKTFLQFVEDAKAAGLLIGAYHYVDDSATTPEAARQEAANFVSAIKDAGGIQAFDLPPVMDYESNKSGLSKAAITTVAKAFLQEVEQLTGVQPIVYTYPSFIGNFSGLNNYPLWVARYSSTQVPPDASGWTSWDFWQYSDGSTGGMLPSGTRKVSGIAGPVDLNEFNGTVDELQTRFKKKGESTVIEKQRDINKVSPWAEDVWTEMTENGYFDGTRPGHQLPGKRLLLLLVVYVKTFSRGISNHANYNRNRTTICKYHCNSSRRCTHSRYSCWTEYS
ncbi:glycoside hydrolase family 25 protein [Paenibacillus farraposensis]|uniref:Glycoside hydrolase family 25 protein n=1 Tax=Paenibacillus farraposensis TaxID=2807095 RepID=A0ABW4DK87_9BACL|nr:glycoside hydrolase family 25 protein [Paenibacillus farraposensis]MCC3381042.1 glycoside hydrolase family 25 protein [Paenibacillus farraposensis]